MKYDKAKHFNIKSLIINILLTVFNIFFIVLGLLTAMFGLISFAFNTMAGELVLTGILLTATGIIRNKMIKTGLLVLIGILLLTYYCNNMTSEDSDNGLERDKIEMKGYPSKNGKMGFTAYADTIVVDWGDGTIEKIISNGKKYTFSHKYSNKEYQTITVKTERLSYFDTNVYGDYHELRFGSCPYLREIDCVDGKLIVLDINKCSSLAAIKCSNNQLTSLNIRGCNALKYLNCSNNQLTVDTLNSIFENLPYLLKSNEPSLEIKNNPGFETCNYGMARDKGWQSMESWMKRWE